MADLHTLRNLTPTVLHCGIAGLEEILPINVSFKLQVLLFKNMSIGTILTAFSLADLYGKGLADCLQGWIGPG